MTTITIKKKQLQNFHCLLKTWGFDKRELNSRNGSKFWSLIYSTTTKTFPDNERIFELVKREHCATTFRNVIFGCGK